MSTSLWLIDNSVVVELSAVKNNVTDQYDNAADVNVTLKTLAGIGVAGQAWPVTMNYVAASDGVYRATINPGVAIKANQSYRAHITATGSGGEIGHWEEEVRAVRRRD